MSPRTIAPAAFAALLALLCAVPAHAAFPGADGPIAFFSGRPIYTVDPGGAHRHVLVDDAIGFGGLSISADGLHVVYDSSHTLYTADIDGTHTRKITDTATANADNPSFSPDGKQVAFERGYGIWVAGAHGGAQHNLTPEADFHHEFTEPAWSPDGRRIAFTYNDSGAGSDRIWTMNADGSGRTELVSQYRQCPQLNFRTMEGSEPDWSPDGRRIVFTGPPNCANSRGTDIWLMNADGSGQTNLVNDDGTEDAAPVFSPSGTRIAFTRDIDGQPHLHVMGADGTGLHGVATGLYADNGPKWAIALRDTRVSERVSHTVVRRRTRVRITGTVTPSRSETATVTVRRGARRVLRRVVHLSHGRYKLAYRPTVRGRYRIVTTVAPGGGGTAGTSVTRTLRVR